MNQTKNIKWKKIRWILLGFVPLFFFVRGIHLIITGGGWIATTDQPIHWILLFLEVFIAAFSSFGCFILCYKELSLLNKEFTGRVVLIKTITFGIIFTFIIHFIRVGFWIQNLIL